MMSRTERADAHDIRPHRGARRRRLGHRARQCHGAGRPQGHAVGARRGQRRAARATARKPIPARRADRGQHRGDPRSRRGRARRGDPAGGAGAGDALGRQGAWRDDCAAHADHRLRQGHRARHPQVHDRGDRRMRAERDAGDPVRPELCRRRGARPADRGHARGPRRDAGGGTWPRRWLAHASGPTIRPTCAASRSAARPRTCWRSPSAS